MVDMLALSSHEAALLVVVALGAGLVRGFSGFALSALVMVGAALVLPPIELIPICWFLEIAASLLMVRGGFAEADRRIVTGLAIGSILGAPIGLALTTSLPVETSKLAALSLILALAALQLAHVRIAALATLPGLYASGFAAGVATGLASVGGMVVALYVLSQNAPARVMRASLVMFLLISTSSNIAYLLYYEVMTPTAAVRGLLLAIPACIGVMLGKRLFTPRYEPYYRPFCLVLLCGLAAFGILRLAFA